MTEKHWSYLCSILSVLMLWQMGCKSLWGPALGLAAQAAWLGFMIRGRHWGLAPCVFGFAALHVVNLWKWM